MIKKILRKWSISLGVYTCKRLCSSVEMDILDYPIIIELFLWVTFSVILYFLIGRIKRADHDAFLPPSKSDAGLVVQQLDDDDLFAEADSRGDENVDGVRRRRGLASANFDENVDGVRR